MITPADIRKKAQRLWQSGRVLRAELTQETLFPWTISFRKPNATQQVENFAAIRDWIYTLHTSKATIGYGYHIDYKTVNHRQLGTQQLPAKIIFTDQEQLLRYLGKVREWQLLIDTAQQTTAAFPALSTWLTQKPTFIKHIAIWQQVLAVCHYFNTHPRPNCYLRELDIVDIDSKFIESHTKLLASLLDIILPEDAINQQVTQLRQHGFERRYGLKFDQPTIRLRLLDQTLYPTTGLSDPSMPISQLAQWHIGCQYVFITENKINGLSFPAMVNSIVIFGLGYGVDSLADIPWLKHCELFYWGDIDTHGFSILSRLRHYFPQVKALMMDAKTLETYQHLAVEEPTHARCQHELSQLNNEEQALYQQLQSSHLRLEQERLPMRYVYNQLPK